MGARGWEEGVICPWDINLLHDAFEDCGGVGRDGISGYAFRAFPPLFPLVDTTRLTQSQDLFGRGFSDGIGDLPHDARLYTTQMLLALASSPLPWTGTNGLRLLGYSLGGGVAVHFANSFPHLVESLVLLAPAGLIRAESFGRSSRIIFKSGLVPDRILSYLTKQRLKKPIANSVQRIREPTPETDKQDEHDGSEGQANTPHIRQLRSESYLDVLTSEAADPPPGQEMTALEVTVLQYVSWMATHHDGFLSAFTSSIQHAPLTDQHEAWGKLGSREEGTTLVMIGRDDELIDPEYFHRDATDVLGEEGMRKVGWKVTRGGHDFVMTHSGEVLKEIKEFWGHGKRRE